MSNHQELTLNDVLDMKVGTIIHVNHDDNMGKISKVIVANAKPSGERVRMGLTDRLSLVVIGIHGGPRDGHVWWMGECAEFAYLTNQQTRTLRATKVVGPDGGEYTVNTYEHLLPNGLQRGDVLSFDYVTPHSGERRHRVVRFDTTESGRIQGLDLSRDGGYRSFKLANIDGPIDIIDSVEVD